MSSTTHLDTVASASVPPAGSWAHDVEADLLRTLGPMAMAGRIWVAGLAMVVALGAFAYVLQLVYGLRVTDLNDYVSWGLYMANFVFFIGISYAGTLISAVLRVTNAEWRRPITRMAEAITVIALLVGAAMIIIDMGRPERLLTMMTSGRLQSPILWDVAALSTYLAGSILYLYVAMIPDLAILARDGRKVGRARWIVRLHEIGSLGFRGTPAQHRRLDIAVGVMAVMMIPVAVSAHTVVSWIFGVTLRPGWHSTIFGPYFVVGAIFSGTAGIITAMAIFRRLYGLERYLRLEHFRNLGLLLLALTLLYSYFTVSEYLTIWYAGESTDARLIALLMGATPYGVAFWSMAVLGLLVPAVLLAVPVRRSIAPIVVAAVLINLGMWLKRYLIVVPTMKTPFLPPEALDTQITYFPSWVEWAVTAGGLAAFLLLFTIFSRVVPIVSIWETAEGEAAPPPGDHPAGAHGPAAAQRPAAALAHGVVRGVPLVLALGTAALLLTSGAAEAGAVVRDGQVAVEVTREEEFGEDLLVAVVTVDGEPLSGARVEFFVQRLFGLMSLGTDQTLPDGSAAVNFPQGLPGNPDGQLDVVVEIRAPADLAGARGEGRVPADLVGAAMGDPFPRALWAPLPPVALVVTIGVLLLIVWGTYAFVVWQLVGILRDAGSAQEVVPERSSS